MKKKIKNPLIKRIPKELRDEWKKYLVVFLFLILTIGFAGAAQQEKRFPVVTSADELEAALKGATASRYVSAEEISDIANLRRLVAQRRHFRNANWQALADNWRHSVFYQLDLDHAAQEFRENQIPQCAQLSFKEDGLARLLGIPQEAGGIRDIGLDRLAVGIHPV